VIVPAVEVIVTFPLAGQVNLYHPSEAVPIVAHVGVPNSVPFVNPTVVPAEYEQVDDTESVVAVQGVSPCANIILAIKNDAVKINFFTCFL
jgi:hypothetical protein